MSERKIITLASLKALASRIKAKKRRIVFTNGCFDLMHAGHIKYLARAKALGDILIVGINSDSSVRKIKGRKRPIVKQGDRASVVAALQTVDYVCIFNETTPFKLIKAVRPDVLVKGADWRPGKIIGADFVRRYGGKAVTVPLVKGRSTSDIIRKVVKRFGERRGL